MKKINILILCSILCFFYSCNGMLDGIQPYLDEGEKIYVGKLDSLKVNPEKPDVPLNKNDAFQKVQKRRVQEKR